MLLLLVLLLTIAMVLLFGYLFIDSGRARLERFYYQTLNLFKIVYVSRKINTKQLGKDTHTYTTTTAANLHDIQIDKLANKACIVFRYSQRHIF